MSVKAAKVTYYPGDGSVARLTVRLLADYPRGLDDTCAYCHGDPCAERSGPETAIGQYYRRNPRAETCPLCDGRPT